MASESGSLRTLSSAIFPIKLLILLPFNPREWQDNGVKSQDKMGQRPSLLAFSAQKTEHAAGDIDRA
jgi:hypothetical protein